MKYFVFAIFMSIIITSCRGKKESPKKADAAPPPVVDVIVASAKTIPNTLEANGTVVAGEFVEIRPEISGRLVYLNIAEGSRIEAGTVIAKINDADLRAQLNKIKVQLELADITVTRYKKLLDIQGINRSEYDL